MGNYVGKEDLKRKRNKRDWDWKKSEKEEGVCWNKGEEKVQEKGH